MLKSVFSPISEKTKVNTLMQIKVHADHVPSFFFFTKPATDIKKILSSWCHVVLVITTA